MLGTIQKVLSLGCCAGLLGPLAPVLLTGGAFEWVPLAWRLPLLCGSLTVALVSFTLGWRRHRRVAPLVLFLVGAAALLYPLHEALDVSLFQILIWLGFGLLLAGAAWETWLAIRSRGRPKGRAGTMRRRVLVGFVALLVALWTVGGLGAAPERVTLKIEGMTASGCSSPASVKATMERTEGVARADVSAERGEAVVELDPARVDLAQLMVTVERYCLVKVTRPAP